MIFENGINTMAIWHNDETLLHHLSKEETQHSFSDDARPCYFGGVGLAGKEFGEGVRLRIVGYPTDVDEFLPEYLKVSFCDVAHREGNVVTIWLSGWFWFADGFGFGGI